MFKTLRSHIHCILQRDPAARHFWEVLTCYPGLHALMLHQLAHFFWKWRAYWVARFIAYVARALTGIEIHPAAQIAPGVFIDHGVGVVIGETAQIAEGCTIYQGVTLGGTSLEKGVKRHPTLGKGVVVGAGAKVLGAFEVGDYAKIGSNAVVIKPVPAGATVVGNPARIILADELKNKALDVESFSAYGVGSADSEQDPVHVTIQALIEQAAIQEQQIALLWSMIEAYRQQKSLEALPKEAALAPSFEADKWRRFIKDPKET